MLLEQNNVILKTFGVNPGIFLFSTLTGNISEYDCLQIIKQAYSSRSDLKDVALEDPDWELYTNKSSFMRDGNRMTSYSVTTTDKVIREKALPTDVSSQRVELIAPTKELELSERKKAKMWTNSEYAFNVVYVNGVIWKER
ncbi:hypothetical protein HGM15179_021015 [Zosterops borbonicus]|uniref:RNase H type-1 domain-containing protein n=1 Tax=Zosterops borbonicus TaxID=364589 RepID=A0A8K1D6V2_9PASS|nr:hypothetical protein HGM15179_021015 [Zosterops borbonicus]